MITGLVYGLDLGVRMGVASGTPGASPHSCAIDLKKPDEPQAVAFSNLIAFLDERFSQLCPQLVAKESMLSLQAYRALGNAEKTVRLHAGLHAVVEGMCRRFGVAWRDVPDSTARKHFIGRANFGARKDTKRAVVARCHLLGFLPLDCSDDNRADAIATWDWAAATFGRRTPESLHLFGEQPGAPS